MHNIINIIMLWLVVVANARKALPSLLNTRVVKLEFGVFLLFECLCIGFSNMFVAFWVFLWLSYWFSPKIFGNLIFFVSKRFYK